MGWFVAAEESAGAGHVFVMLLCPTGELSAMIAWAALVLARPTGHAWSAVCLARGN